VPVHNCAYFCVLVCIFVPVLVRVHVHVHVCVRVFVCVCDDERGGERCHRAFCFNAAAQAMRMDAYGINAQSVFTSLHWQVKDSLMLFYSKLAWPIQGKQQQCARSGQPLKE